MDRTLTDHLAAVLDLAGPPRAARLQEVSSALGLVLATDHPARLPVPPFTNSAMDGYLVRSADLPGAGPWTLPVAGDVPAGSTPRPLPPGTALRIMTGAPLPDEAEGLRVVPVEDTDCPAGPGPLPATVTIHRISADRTHIRHAGENITVGTVALPAGALLDSGAVAAAVSCGLTHVEVHPRPRVAVISSGDELLSPGCTPGPGQLPDSNRVMLTSLLAEHGVTEVTHVHSTDSAAGFRTLLSSLAAEHDLLLTTGGVSVGAFDVVREVTEPAGVWFGTVAQRPGRHQGAGRWNGVPLLCLPGNPVAAFVSFLLYVPPLLRVLAGSAPQADLWSRPHVGTRLAGSGIPARPHQHLLVPVRLAFSPDGITATPFDRRIGSHLVASLADIDGLAVIPPGNAQPTAGQPVRVLLRLR